VNARLLDRDRTGEQIKALGPWFHNMNLNGVWTAPNHPLGDYPAIKWNRFAATLPVDLSGKSVLDIGCNGGFYSIEMKRRGARRVVGIDHDPDYLAQARFAADVLRLDIEFHQLSVFDIALLGERFDVVIFMGVLYHLRHPLLALDLIRAHTAHDMLIFQSMQRGGKGVAELADDYPITETGIFDQPDYPKLHFIENRYAHDPTNWFVPNRAAAEAMLRSAGFVIEAHPEEEVYICRCGPQMSEAAVYPPKRVAP
jgi:tRNA (mo5U34)-methyltransferase